MDVSLVALRINEERFRRNFDELARIGATPGGGVHRPALSEAHLKSRRWFLEQANRIGLEPGIDGAGNHSALLRCGPGGGPVFLVGSHLDSVPHGGRFDGALGVTAALEVLQVVREHGLTLKHDLEVVDFSDEEGRFISMLGSRALTGALDRETLHNPKGGLELFREALAGAGLNLESVFSASRPPESLAGYLELHIEQGQRLKEKGIRIGIVTGIVGIRVFNLIFKGRADHAGTTPLGLRYDPGLGASAWTLAARELIMTRFPEAVVTVGKMAFHPGAFNVVPESVTVTMEFRADRTDRLDAMESALLELAETEARRFNLELDTRMLQRVPPAATAQSLQRILAEASGGLGLEYSHLPSGAGHDAQSLAHICPVGMVFVPSEGGRSHSDQEFTAWEDCVNGANTLLQAVLSAGI